MVKTASTMLAIGTPAPPFELMSTGGNRVSLEEFRETKALLVMFICNHCPFVKHVADELTRLTNDFMPRGLSAVGINSNDTEKYPDDSFEAMKQEVLDRGYQFPYLLDESQEVAAAYRAACTPDFYLFGPELKLVYRGQLDDSRPNSGIPVTGKNLRNAIEQVLSGQEVSQEQIPSIGCNIKWIANREPDYFNPNGIG